jgi:hypothetical protein
MEMAGFGQVTAQLEVCGKTITVKLHAAIGVPMESMTMQVTTFVPSGKVEPLGGLQK